MTFEIVVSSWLGLASCLRGHSGRRQTPAQPGLDRSHRREHVQRQERGADPASSPRADCPPAGTDFKPVIDTRYGDDHIVSHSEMRIGSAAVAELAGAAEPGGPRTRRSSASTRGSSSTRTCRQSATRWRIKASASSWPDSIRTTWASRSSRCRSCSRLPNTSPRRWRSAWCAAIPPITPSGSWPAKIACSLGAKGPTRRDAADASTRCSPARPVKPSHARA